jgi:hypothetical protein
MRRSRAVAARIGAGALVIASVGAALVVIKHAIADPGDPGADEAIRTAPESFPDFDAQAPVAAPPATAKAETIAVQSPVPVLPLEAAVTSAKAMREMAIPHLAEVERATVRYEPKLAFHTVHTLQGQTETKVTLALGSNLKSALAKRLGRKVGFQPNSRAVYGDRGRWYVFGATSNDAIGFNMLQGMHGEVRRAGFTAERVAAIGDRQAGVAWRKGNMQASLAYVVRELSSFGASMQQHFVALTISFKAPGRPEKIGPRRVSPYAPYQPDWPPEERDPRLRR